MHRCVERGRQPVGWLVAVAAVHTTTFDLLRGDLTRKKRHVDQHERGPGAAVAQELSHLQTSNARRPSGC